MEANLLDWFDERRALGLAISNDVLCAEAREQYQQWWIGLGVEGQARILNEDPRKTAFTASEGWFSNFKKRYRISLRRKTKDSGQVPENANELIAQFRADVRNDLQTFADNQVANIDEVFTLFDNPGSYTYNRKGNAQIDIRSSRGNPRLGCTVTLAITMDGGKMPPHITFRQPPLAEWGELQDNVPDNVLIAQSPTGWMRGDIMLEYLENEFIPFMQGRQEEQGDYQPFLLIWDRARVHLTEAVALPVIEHGGVIELVPAGCTPIVQPLDVSVIHSFKVHLRILWRLWKQENTTPDGQCPRISLLQVTRLVTAAWEQVPEHVVSHSFHAAGLHRDDAGFEVEQIEEAAVNDGDNDLQFFSLPETYPEQEFDSD